MFAQYDFIISLFAYSVILLAFPISSTMLHIPHLIFKKVKNIETYLESMD
jgi:hypothetical protein